MAQPQPQAAASPQAMQALGFEIRNPERFARNMAELVGETGKAVTAALQPYQRGAKRAAVTSDIDQVLKTLAQVQQAWLMQPYKVFEAQTALWQSYLDLWGSWMRRLMGGDAQPVVAPDAKDAR